VSLTTCFAPDSETASGRALWPYKPIRVRNARASNYTALEEAMKAKTIILTTSAMFALAIGMAEAGQCTSEIDSLSKVLATKDAGSGPTSTGSVTSGQHPPTTAMSQADQEHRRLVQRHRYRLLGSESAATPQCRQGKATLGKTWLGQRASSDSS
jgi:hypothetical protein